MRLSKLQKYILGKCYLYKSAHPADFKDFYKKSAGQNLKIIHDVIHKSLESLTAKDLIVSYGKKTAKKWFITKIKLTAQGRHLAVTIIKNRQRRLPIK